ncbi:recombinase family protein [Clostridium saccharoperbutylacetonicum]|uniref:recombinase family protein n=1 Tax=Clostridium saccharoperbutylacetonicum TaxID=36745 RepID=UPI0012EB9A50|nr:recombinase family protein [Clostridium saccharoperbutylacetonicum]
MVKKTYAYARVSTRDQSLERQLEAISAYCKENNISIDKEREIFKEKKSGKNFNREVYIALKENFLREGDTLIIKELDRLGRDMLMIKEEWQDLQKRGIEIVVIDTPILNTVGKTDLEKTLIANIVFELLSYMAEKERIKIRQRQAEGIAAMKVGENGKKISSKTENYIGRPSIEYPVNWEEGYSKWKNGEITGVKAMELMGLKRNSFYNLVKRFEKLNRG